MGKIIIQEETVKNPITLAGKEAGICWGADVSDNEKNYKRGLTCFEDGHWRTMEFGQIYATIDGYSARVIRELYTHIAGGPTRLQASTRYINYERGFDYIVPKTIEHNPEAKKVYLELMEQIQKSLKELEDLGIPREDSANGLPLGMTTLMVLRTNLRNFVDMSRQRCCNRAYWEFRELMKDFCDALCEYSDEWKLIVERYVGAKCEFSGYCEESRSCGRYPKRER